MLTIFISLMHPVLGSGVFLAADDAGINLFDIFNGAEIFGKVIVLLLMFFSLLAWTVMIGKYLELSNWRQSNLDFYRELREKEALMSQTVTPKLRQSAPYARMFHDALEAGRQHRSDREPSVRMGLISNALQRRVADECVQYERKMVLLGSLVSGAPFMGLLGTVVGVMVAFKGMQNGVSLQTIGPGVASALLATVCGLLVAIPSVFGYNFLLAQTKIMITELENYASWLADRFELEMEAQQIGPYPTMPTTQPAIQAPVAHVAPAAPAHSYYAPAAQPASKPAAPPPASAPERYLKLDVSEEE
ncbi:MAG TPA: MotA/TolQ/ExbB proton channel family protein [Opitutales bacterium]|jgi:biopolymer transport protein TolQ|nr:MotA/TolQ/ExbB proton channel family protein [Opitutales bacterium]